MYVHSTWWPKFSIGNHGVVSQLSFSELYRELIYDILQHHKLTSSSICSVHNGHLDNTTVTPKEQMIHVLHNCLRLKVLASAHHLASFHIRDESIKHSSIALGQIQPIVSRVLLQEAIKLSQGVLWHKRVLL